MYTASAEEHFGGRAAIARELSDARSASAVYQWGEVVPLAAARRLAAKAPQKLEVIEGLYDELGRILPKSKRARNAA